jgi:hypothetical protein
MYYVEPKQPEKEAICIHCKSHKIIEEPNGWTDSMIEMNYCWNKKTQRVWKCYVTGAVDRYYRKCGSINSKGDCEFYEPKEETLRTYFEEHQRSAL